MVRDNFTNSETASLAYWVKADPTFWNDLHNIYLKNLKEDSVDLEKCIHGFKHYTFDRLIACEDYRVGGFIRDWLNYSLSQVHWNEIIDLFKN